MFSTVVLSVTEQAFGGVEDFLFFIYLFMKLPVSQAASDVTNLRREPAGCLCLLLVGFREAVGRCPE